MLNRFPDRTFVFAVISLLMSLAAFGYLTLGSAIEIEVVDNNGNLRVERESIGESYGIWGVIFALVPVVLNLGSLLAIPTSGKTERRHKFNLIFGTALMWIFIGVFMRGLGLLYVPAATMLTSVVVLAFIREKTWARNAPEEQDKPPRTKSSRELRAETARRHRRSRNRVGRRPQRRSRLNR